MKFLFDQSADFRLSPYLEDFGHDVAVISRQYPHGLPDEDVLAIARREQRVLIVADRDFGGLIFQQHKQHAASSPSAFPARPWALRSSGSAGCFQSMQRISRGMRFSW